MSNSTDQTYFQQRSRVAATACFASPPVGIYSIARKVLVGTISAATIDRVLFNTCAHTLVDSRDPLLGRFEIDMFEYFRSSKTDGERVHTPRFTDVANGWIECMGHAYARPVACY
jgi:hypothetical protein